MSAWGNGILGSFSGPDEPTDAAKADAPRSHDEHIFAPHPQQFAEVSTEDVGDTCQHVGIRALAVELEVRPRDEVDVDRRGHVSELVVAGRAVDPKVSKTLAEGHRFSSWSRATSRHQH